MPFSAFWGSFELFSIITTENCLRLECSCWHAGINKRRGGGGGLDLLLHLHSYLHNYCCIYKLGLFCLLSILDNIKMTSSQSIVKK